LKDAIKEPKRYLGAGVEKVDLLNGKQCWAFKADHYVENSIRTLEKLFEEDRKV
jgi:hypothetical protein